MIQDHKNCNINLAQSQIEGDALRFRENNLGVTQHQVPPSRTSPARLQILYPQMPLVDPIESPV